MEKEIWKDIKGFEGKYAVSNTGKVKSLKRATLAKNGDVMNFKEKELKPFLKMGYPTVYLYRGEKPKRIKVHRLVAEQFIPNPENKTQVNHLDGVKVNNAVENLEWVTGQENVRHAHQIGLSNSPRGTGHWKSKLTDENILDIRKRTQRKEKQKDIAEIYGVSDTTIRNIQQGKNWTHIPKEPE